MAPTRLQVERALAMLPDLDDLLPLREALLGGSRADEKRRWAASEAYMLLDTRLADAGALEARIPELAERERERVERLYRHVAAAMRAAAEGDLARAAEAMVEAGEVEEAAGRPAAAAHCYRKARDLGRKPRDRRGEGLALRRLGRVLRALGDLEGAERSYGEGYRIAEAQRDAGGMLVACQGLGNVCGDQGRWPEAERWYARGLELAGEEPTRAHWQLQSNLSVVARRAGRLEESRGWLDRARSTVAALEDAAGRVYVANAEGLLLAAEGRPGVAEAAYREALAAARSPAERATVLVNLAECLTLLGRLPEAEQALRELERLALVHALASFLPYVYRGLGQVARSRGDEEGFLFYEQALELCAGPGVPRVELAITQQEYGGFEAALGRPEPAAARLRQALEIYGELGMETERARVEREIGGLEPPDPRPDDANVTGDQGS